MLAAVSIAIVGWVMAAPDLPTAALDSKALVVLTPSRKAWARNIHREASGMFGDTTGTLMVVAHAAYESGFGAAKAALSNNLFNLTAGSTWHGAVIEGGDLEYKPDGSMIRIIQRFRVYKTIRDGLLDYWTFIGKARYGKARERLLAGDSTGFITALADGAFFTLPRERYLENFKAHLHSLVMIDFAAAGESV